MTVSYRFGWESYDSFALPVYIYKEEVFVLCSAVRYLRSAVGNVHSAVVNARSAMRNINQTRCTDTLKQGIMQTSIRLSLYIYNYLTHSVSIVYTKHTCEACSAKPWKSDITQHRVWTLCMLFTHTPPLTRARAHTVIFHFLLSLLSLNILIILFPMG